MSALGRDVVFEDFFPSMVEKLGAEGFLKELRNGFRVLMDEEREVITFDSLKKNSELLGLKDNMSDDEVMCMLSEEKSRRGKMWVKWFQFNTLKSMDEELAEEADADRQKKRWLWPSTGEVFWQGIYEKERNLKNKEKEKRRQQSKDKIKRIKNRTHQKALGKYVKPPPEDLEISNTTTTTTATATTRLMR